MAKGRLERKILSHLQAKYSTGDPTPPRSVQDIPRTMIFPSLDGVKGERLGLDALAPMLEPEVADVMPALPESIE